MKESESRSRSRGRSFGRRSFAAGGLGAAACIVALVTAAVFWRPTAGAPAVTGSPAASGFAAASRPSAASQPESATPAAQQSPAASSSLPSAPPLVSWNDNPVTVSEYDRLDPNFGWVVGYTFRNNNALYVTTDGGSTWDKRPVPYGLGTREATGFEFIDHDHAFVAVTTGSTAYTVAVIRSSDGGRTWTQSIVLKNKGFDSIGFQMVDKLHGWLLLADSRVVSWLWRTADGGVTWTPLVDTANQANAPARMRFVSDLEGWGLPENGRGLVHTLDGGKTWTRASVPTPTGYTEGSMSIGWPQGSPPALTLHGTASRDGGTSTTAAGVIWASSDDGSTWTIDQVDWAPEGLSRPPLGVDAHAVYSGSSLVSLVFDRPDGQQLTLAASGLNVYGPPVRLMSAAAYTSTDAWVVVDYCEYTFNMASPIFHRRPSCPRLLATWDAGATWHPLLWTRAGATVPSPSASPMPSAITNP